MTVKELRTQLGFSQSKFAAMFNIPVSTLKDWEQERRTPPPYVLEMIKTILEMRGLIISKDYIEACNKRRKSVETALAIAVTAADAPDDIFMDALEAYIEGKMSLKELEERVDRLEYLEGYK